MGSLSPPALFLVPEKAKKKRLMARPGFEPGSTVRGETDMLRAFRTGTVTEYKTQLVGQTRPTPDVRISPSPCVNESAIILHILKSFYH